jgi:hypothetical protein
VEFLKGKVRDVADRSKQRGNMLAQLALAVRRVADAKQQLQSAEGELQEVLAAAEDYLQVRLLLMLCIVQGSYSAAASRSLSLGSKNALAVCLSAAAALWFPGSYHCHLEG